MQALINYVKEQLLKKGADDVIVAASNSKYNQIKFYNNKISNTETSNSVDVSIFLSLGKRIVSTSLKDLSKDKINSALDYIIKFAKTMKPNQQYAGIAKGPFKYKKVKDGYDKKIELLNEDSIEIVENAINKAREEGAKRVAGVLQFSSGQNWLSSSGKIKATDKATSAYFSVRAFTDKDASGHSVSVSRNLANFNPEQAAIWAASIAKSAINPIPGKEGKFDILFEPLPFANILSTVGEASSAFYVEAGLSCLANKLGKQVANSKFSLFDNGILANGLGSCAFDGEGVPTKKTKIIDSGTLKTYLHNTSTAKRYKTKTTANAGLVTPMPHNLVVKAGNTTKQEMLSFITKGIYVTNVWYTRFQNYATGDFSTIPRDGIFLIRDGKLSYPIKNIRINANLIQFLKNIKTVGKIQQHVLGWDFEIPALTPAVLVKGVKVTKV